MKEHTSTVILDKKGVVSIGLDAVQGKARVEPAGEGAPACYEVVLHFGQVPLPVKFDVGYDAETSTHFITGGIPDRLFERVALTVLTKGLKLRVSGEFAHLPDDLERRRPFDPSKMTYDLQTGPRD